MVDPMYRVIADDLEAQIKSGELPPGSQLRTELELQKKYEASRNTVREAVKWLITRGLVETRPGQGTFVLEKIVPFITTLSTNPTKGSSEGAVHHGEAEVVPQSSRPQVEIQAADPAIALQLALNEGEEVVSRHQKRYIDGTPWSLQTSFYPMSLVDRGADMLIKTRNITQGTVAYLEETLGVEQAGYRDTIRVRAPSDSESSFFGVPADGRVMILAAVRTAFDQHGAPIRVTVTVYPADRTRFAVTAGFVPADAPMVIVEEANAPVAEAPRAADESSELPSTAPARDG
jgi:GntR family transcriptional regulator